MELSRLHKEILRKIYTLIPKIEKLPLEYGDIDKAKCCVYDVLGLEDENFLSISIYHTFTRYIVSKASLCIVLDNKFSPAYDIWEVCSNTETLYKTRIGNIGTQIDPELILPGRYNSTEYEYVDIPKEICFPTEQFKKDITYTVKEAVDKCTEMGLEFEGFLG